MGTLRLYNTASRSEEELVTREPGRVGMYVCGPTVYDVPHAGHARSAVVFDILARQLRAAGLELTYVRNITDIDDKILDRAKKNGESPLELSHRMEAVYRGTMARIGCLSPTHEPRVSDHLAEITAMIGRLVELGRAYPSQRPDGSTDVYYSVRSFPHYCKLSHKNLEDLRAGARVDVDELKQDPFDFALWKGAPESEWGWPSPWGHGRPGWHIECSAMSERYLGPSFDIHGGGMDLVFPHHENEIAQSEGAHPEHGDYAKYWVHNGFVNVDKEKMSKSLGNFVTVDDVLARNDAEGLRWFLLGVHYRKPLAFETAVVCRACGKQNEVPLGAPLAETPCDGCAAQLENARVVFPGVDEAERRVDAVYAALHRLQTLSELQGAPPVKPLPELAKLAERVIAAEASAVAGLEDDLDTARALAAVQELVAVANDLADLAQKRRKDVTLGAGARGLAVKVEGALDRVARTRLGLLSASMAEYGARTRTRRLALRNLTEAEIEARIAARVEARNAKDFARGDELRAELTQLGISCRDTPTGTEWGIDV